MTKLRRTPSHFFIFLLLSFFCTLNVLRIINDTTAAALGYGITKADNPKHVAFIDVGHSSLSVAIVAYSKGQLTVKSTAYDRNLGGRDIDYALVKHFAAEFKEKYKIDVLSNPKAVFRLAAATEKLKKDLFANTQAPNYYPAIDDSGLNLDETEVVELIGGSSRIPAVRARIAKCFPGKTLSTTLNQDEAVARGATFSCAMLSPVFRVREFSVSDINAYPIKVQWAPVPSDPEEDTEPVVFGEGNAIPSTKILSFHRKDPFDIEAVYAKPENLPGGINPWIPKSTAKEVPLLGQENPGDAIQVKLKTRLNANVQSAEMGNKPLATTIPSELRCHIATFCAPATLASLALVHKSFQKESEAILYKQLNICLVSKNTKSRQIWTTLKLHTRKANLVHSLTIWLLPSWESPNHDIRTAYIELFCGALANMHALWELRLYFSHKDMNWQMQIMAVLSNGGDDSFLSTFQNISIKHPDLTLFSYEQEGAFTAFKILHIYPALSLVSGATIVHIWG
ncbi:Hsp70 protein-domain-containing protein [Lentinula edodes]|uniref:Hsp70 protein-domain-containing protein n=1 Tax=Lentinula lateritia TaxID=40482 RepID=A0A9W9DW71_9AGAR|nr:Hsp70 protein-domain-containing protein [Lentinula edodes]